MGTGRYIITILFTTVLILLSVSTFNLIIDPYGMFRLCDISRVNTYKPDIYTRVRLFKAHELLRVKPDSIVLGTSRSHLGLNPRHKGWAQNSQRPYNLAFDGATTKEMYYFLMHAQAINPLKHVILGLDTYLSTKAIATTRPDFDPEILMDQNHLLSGLRMLLTDFKILNSFDTLINSLKTIRAQNTGEGQWFADDGQRLGEVFFRRPSEDFQKMSPRYYFDEIDQMEVRYKLEWLIPQSNQFKVYFSAPEKKDTLTSLDYIRKIIEYCRKEDIDLKIFFTPSHAHQLEISAATNEWAPIENGKREVLKILSEDAARNPEKHHIPLFDFSNYSSVTMEPLPLPDTHQEMRYYWDSSHFKENVGDLVLDRLFDFHQSDRPIPEDFGVLLTGNNIEQVLAQIRETQVIYRQRYPEDVKIIKKLVDDFKLKNHIHD